MAVALFAAPAAVAHDSPNHPRSAVVTPAKGKWLGESWAQVFSLPVSEHPWLGNGSPCLTLTPRVVEVVGERPCTIEEGTTIMTWIGSEWSSLEDPFPTTEAQQRALALEWDQANVLSVNVAIDGGATIDIRKARFEVFSPQRSVVVPVDNIFFDLEEPTAATFTAHAWAAAIHGLRPGQHRTVATTMFAGEAEPFVAVHHIRVVPRRHVDGELSTRLARLSEPTAARGTR